MYFKTKISSLALIMVFTVSTVCASDLIQISPITSRILMLHFDDGHIDYYGYHQDRNSNVIYHHPLKVAEAEKSSNYGIVSADDVDFSEVIRPDFVRRKSKGMDFNEPEWGNPDKVEFIHEHHIYLMLPEPLKRGCTYTITLSEHLSASKREITFMYSETSMRSEAIHLNQLGYTPDQVKYAYLSQWMGSNSSEEEVDGALTFEQYSGARFFILPADAAGISDALFTGFVSKRKDRSTTETTHKDYAPDYNYSLTDVWQCDFSSFTTPGEYILVVEGMGCSYPFEIREDVYRDAYYHASRGLFYQRQGIAKEIYDNLVWPRDHHPDDIPHYYMDDLVDPKHVKRDADLTGYPQVHDIWGYYHDAGDWDRVVGHDKIPMVLMSLYEMKPENFSDGDIRNKYKLNNDDPQYIEEGANGIPDLLDEARWLIDFSRRARSALMDQELGTGGVPGGYMGREGAAGGKPAWEDTKSSAVTAESPTATYNFAGNAAWYGTILKELGRPSGEYQPWIDDAVAAYKWAEDNGGGDTDAHVYAAVSLYRATQNSAYQEHFKDRYSGGGNTYSHPLYWEQSAWIYGTLPNDFPGLDTAFQRGKVTNHIVSAANNLVDAASDRGFRFGIPQNRPFNLGSHNTPRVQILAMAYEITGDKKYLDCLHNTVSYTLGGNEMNMVALTRVGDQPEKFVFHPNSWLSIDYNSKVYTNPVVDGMLSYFGNTVGWVGGVGDELWSQSSLYPDEFKEWPKAEGRIPNRNSIAGSEFTVPQNNVQAIFAYGYVAGPSDGNYRKNSPPEVEIIYPANRAQLKTGADITIQVNTTPDTRKVMYYADAHFIGSTKTTPFSFTWNEAPVGSHLITAVAYDDKGRVSEPTEEGDIVIEVGDYPEIAVASVGIENCPDHPIAVLSGLKLTPLVLPLNATNKNVSWNSSDPAVIKINSEGEVFASGAGEAVITIETEEGGYAASCTIQVTAPVKVFSVNFRNCASGLVGTGQTITMQYELLPADASDKRVFYSSSNESVATVNELGLVTGISEGVADIIIESSDGVFSDTCNIDVYETNLPPEIDPVPDTTILVNSDPFTIHLTGISDGNIADQELSMVIDNNKPLLIPDPEVDFNPQAGNATLTFTPIPDAFGRVKVAVELEDDGGTDFGGKYRTEMEFNIHIVYSLSPEIPGLIQAEDYDEVTGEVTVDYASDYDGTDYVGWIGFSDQMQYALSSVDKGVYDVTLRVTRGEAGLGGKAVFVSGEDTLGIADIDYTGSWLSWRDVEMRLMMEEGPQTLLLTNGNTRQFHLNWMKFAKTDIPCCIEDLRIENCSDSLVIGDSLQLNALMEPEDAFIDAVSWISSDTSIATVDQSGLVFGKSYGMISVYLETSDQKVRDSCSMTIVHPLSVSVPWKDQIKVYPNPAQRQIIISPAEYIEVYEISDLNGRVLMRHTTKGLHRERVDVEALEPGFYVLTLQHSSGAYFNERVKIIH